MGTLDETTSLVELGAFMFVMGAGVGMLMQNLVLVVQNTVRFEDIGAGTSLVAFFRCARRRDRRQRARRAARPPRAAPTSRPAWPSRASTPTGSADQVPDVTTLPGPGRRR